MRVKRYNKVAPRLSRGVRLLAAYLEINDIPRADFANAAKLTPVELSHFLAGRRVPMLARAVVIEDATGGGVPCRAWVE